MEESRYSFHQTQIQTPLKRQISYAEFATRNLQFLAQESAMQRTKRSIQLFFSLILLMAGFVPHAGAHTLEAAPQNDPTRS